MSISFFDLFGWLNLFQISTVRALFPPTFLHNFLPLVATERTITFSAITPSVPPAFPTAHSVTVARIASPYSVHRSYQAAFLAALKDYFQGRRRILKEKDIIAVGISEEGARFGTSVAEEDEIELVMNLIHSF